MSQRQRTPPSRLRAQRGMSLIGLMAWAIIVGFIGYLAVRVLPTEYSITSIAGKDLEVTKENDKLVIRFAYDKEIPIVQPVYLLLKYQGQSK